MKKTKTTKPKTKKANDTQSKIISKVEISETEILDETAQNSEAVNTNNIYAEISKENLLETLSETSEATHESDAPTLEKGNVIEQQIINSENSETPLDGNTVIDKESETTLGGKPRKNKPGAGRPKKNVSGSSQPVTQSSQDMVDPILMAFDGMALPLIAKKFEKNYEDCKLSKTQAEELKKVTPPMDWAKPSWINYAIFFLGFHVMNFNTASDSEAKKARLKWEKEQESKIENQIKEKMTAFNNLQNQQKNNNGETQK